MKVVVNRAWGCFRIPSEVCDALGCDSFGQIYDTLEDIARTNPDLIECLEEYGLENTTLEIVDIPDSATDWRISDYDGMETILAVIDGKIVDL